MESEWQAMTAADLGRGIGAGKIDPNALVEAFLAAVTDHPAAGRIYARMTADRARAEASAAASRARSGTRRGPLDGVPISWKDLFDTAGVATEGGTRLLEGRVPGRDALVLARASREGLVCLGKTHQTELAFSGLGVNPMTATPPNINGADLAPGGSSSGAASSVSFGLAAAGIGSDTGGSVRIPAGWQDLVGLKTSSGVLPLDGVLPLCARFDTVGPLCRSVEDAALIFDALDGAAARPLAPADTAGRRFAVLQAQELPAVDPEPQAAFEATLARLSAAGAIIDHLPAPEVDIALPLSGALFSPEAYGTWSHEIEAAPDKMFAPVRERFQSGQSTSAPQFVAAWQVLDQARAAFRARIAGYDAVLMPTSPILPPIVERLLSDPDYFAERNLHALRNTRVGNLLDMCALTLPCGVKSCGLMLMRPGGEDALLLQIGAGVEKTLR